MQKIRNIFVYFVLVSITSIGFMQPVQAALIGTELVATAVEADMRRDKLAATLNRPEVLAQLEQMGVSNQDAQARVAALSDAEIAALAERIDSLPAGGESIIGALVLIFVLLLVTDIIGLTKVFPFTRSVR